MMPARCAAFRRVVAEASVSPRRSGPSSAPAKGGLREPVGDAVRFWRDSEQRARLLQRLERMPDVERLGTILFGELRAVGAQHQRRVQVTRRGQAKQTLQMDLPRGVVG